MFQTELLKDIISFTIQLGHLILIQICQVLQQKGKLEFGLMKILGKIILIIKSVLFNQPEQIKHISTIVTMYHQNKSKWSETLLMLFKIDANKANSLNNSEKEFDKTSASLMQEGLFNKNWTIQVELELIELICGEIQLNQRFQKLKVVKQQVKQI